LHIAQGVFNPSLVWSDALSLSMPVMDDTHHEFVDLLAAAEDAADDALPKAWQTLIDPTAEHFAREDRWMVATGFAPGNCHATQHAVVRQVLRDGLEVPDPQRPAIIRRMAQELAQWFPQHAQSMDAALALHLNSVGFDPETGELSDAQALPQRPIEGCGGSCGQA
jgi:hemerythrin-like metal-binding protein